MTTRHSPPPQARYSSNGRYALGEQLARRDGLMYRWAAAIGDPEATLLIAVPAGASPDEVGSGQDCEQAAQRGLAYWERNLLWRQQDVRGVPLPVSLLEQYPLCRALRDACREEGDSRTLHRCPHALVALPRGVRLDRFLRHHPLSDWDALRLGIQLLAHVESLPEPWQRAPLAAADFIAAGADEVAGDRVDLVRFHLVPNTLRASGPVGAPRRLLLQLSSRWPQTFGPDASDRPLLTPAQARARYGHLPARLTDALVALASAPAAMWPSLRDLSQLWRSHVGLQSLIERDEAYDIDEPGAVREGHEAWSITTPRSAGRWRFETPFAHGARGELYRAGAEGGARALAKLNRYRYDSFREFREALDERRAELSHEAQVLRALGSRSSQLPRFVSFEAVTRRDGWFSASPEYGEAESALYMERLPGVPLTRLVSRLRCEPRAVLWCMMELARALRVFHRAGYVFQDLKTENVIVDPLSGRLSLVDVGSSCPVDADGALDSTSPAFGAQTRGFAAPEFDENWRSVDFRFDLFSLGAVGYHLATGRDPEVEVLKAGEGGAEELAFAPLAALPPALRQVIGTCLAPTFLRYDNTEQLIEAIKDALHDLDPFMRSGSSQNKGAASSVGLLSADEPTGVRVLWGRDGALLSWRGDEEWTLEMVELYASAGEVPVWSSNVLEHTGRVITLPRNGTQGWLAQLRFRHRDGARRSVSRLVEPSPMSEGPPLGFVTVPEGALDSNEELERELPRCGLVYRQREATRLHVFARLPDRLSEHLELRLFGDDGARCRAGFRSLGGELYVAELNRLRADHHYHLAACLRDVEGPAAVLAWTKLRALPQPLDVWPCYGPGSLTLRYDNPSCRLSGVTLQQEGDALPLLDGQRCELAAGHHTLTLIERYDEGRVRRAQTIDVDIPPRDLHVEISVHSEDHESGSDALHEVVLDPDVEVLPVELQASLSPELRPQQATGLRLELEYRRVDSSEAWAPLHSAEQIGASGVEEDCGADDGTRVLQSTTCRVRLTKGGPLELVVPYEVRAVATFTDGSTRRSPELRLRCVERLPAPLLRPKLAALVVAPPPAGVGAVEVRLRRQGQPEVERVVPSSWPHVIALPPGETCLVSWRRHDLTLACPFSAEVRARAQQRPELPRHVRVCLDAQKGVPLLSWSFAGTRHEDDVPEVRIFAQADEGALRLAYRGRVRSRFTDTLWQGEKTYVLDTFEEGLRSQSAERLRVHAASMPPPLASLRTTSQRIDTLAVSQIPCARLHRLTAQKSVLECVHSGEPALLLVRAISASPPDPEAGVVLHELAAPRTYRKGEGDMQRWWSSEHIALAPTTGFRTLIPLPEHALAQGDIELRVCPASPPFRWQRVPVKRSSKRALVFSVVAAPGEASGKASTSTGQLVSLRSGLMGDGSNDPLEGRLDLLTFGHFNLLSKWEQLHIKQGDSDLVEVEQQQRSRARHVLASVGDERVVLLPYAPDVAAAIALLERYQLERLIPLAIRLAIVEAGGVILRAGGPRQSPQGEFLYQGLPYAVKLRARRRRNPLSVRYALRLEGSVLTPSGIHRFCLRPPQARSSSLLSWLVSALGERIRSSFVERR